MKPDETDEGGPLRHAMAQLMDLPKGFIADLRFEEDLFAGAVNQPRLVSLYQRLKKVTYYFSIQQVKDGVVYAICTHVGWKEIKLQSACYVRFVASEEGLTKVIPGWE